MELRLLLPTALALLATAGVGNRGNAAPSADEQQPRTVDEVLEQSLESDFDAGKLRGALHALAGPILPDLFEALCEGTTRAGEPLDEPRRILVRTTLVRTPLGELRPFLESLATGPTPVDRRMAAMGILGAAGEGRDVALLARMAPVDSQQVTVGIDQRQVFSAALAEIAARDPEVSPQLGSVLRQAHPSLAAPLVRAMASADDAERLLAAELHVNASYDELILLELARLGESRRLQLDELQRRTIRALLDGHNSVATVTLATRAAAGARDDDAVPALIDLLESPDRVIAKAARVALESITRQRLRDDVEAWRAWHSRELKWWRDESQDTFRRVTGRDAADAGNAIRELSARRLFVDRVAQGLIPALDRDDPELVLLACSALAQLEATSAVPRLVDCLDHEHAGVRDLAWKTLRDLTGRQLGPDPRLWRERVLAQPDKTP
ncbi:hypothetical protein [Engelhardtia mirabilis]|uniref:Armadillo/beta-catenin-like repeat protein n=1 Tax=Engelhardtia mirabilis TaxID=2528011 RepID=A0A518BEK0_9BACT|nr:Armadillo/beta-catenin-like repeat protein [Planctomycetes bacterium Pla133]QDU99737.1 Armadillo/beta-catenin-like repeat protein [Planctomycetes bacterium Pla86]